METIIVYLDDADYALPLLQAAQQAPTAAQTHWVLVACAPRITHRVSRLVSNRSRENWRSKWADKLFGVCVPVLNASGARVTTVLARVPLAELLQSLQLEHGPQAQIVDLRRPKLQEAPQPVAVSPSPSPLRKLSSTLTGIGALWTVLLGETLAA